MEEKERGERREGYTSMSAELLVGGRFVNTCHFIIGRVTLRAPYLSDAVNGSGEDQTTKHARRGSEFGPCTCQLSLTTLRRELERGTRNYHHTTDG